MLFFLALWHRLLFPQFLLCCCVGLLPVQSCALAVMLAGFSCDGFPYFGSAVSLATFQVVVLPVLSTSVVCIDGHLWCSAQPVLRRGFSVVVHISCFLYIYMFIMLVALPIVYFFDTVIFRHAVVYCVFRHVVGYCTCSTRCWLLICSTRCWLLYLPTRCWLLYPSLIVLIFCALVVHLGLQVFLHVRQRRHFCIAQCGRGLLHVLARRHLCIVPSLALWSWPLIFVMVVLTVVIYAHLPIIGCLVSLAFVMYLGGVISALRFGLVLSWPSSCTYAASLLHCVLVGNLWSCPLIFVMVYYTMVVSTFVVIN